MNYKLRLFLYFSLVFVVFTASVIGFEQWRERKYRIEMLSSSLLTYSYAAQNEESRDHLPDGMRVTIIENNGRVVFDNGVDAGVSMVNHFDRPEIKSSKSFGTGYDIRTSTTTGKEYFYFARRIADGYVRVAMPYDANTETLLTPDRGFVIFVVLLFVVSIFFLWVIARRFGSDLESLKRKVVSESEARTKMKSEMTSAIAHELRTPVASIRSYSETLCSSDVDEKTRSQFAERIHSASLRLSSMLENVSLLTKMEEAADRFKRERVDVSAVVAEVVEEFSTTAEHNSVKIINELPKDIIIEGNQTLVYSIWRNLIENSLKYGGNWIAIIIKLEREDDNKYHFVVRDSGPGVEDKHLPRLFERFYRVDSGRTREVGGSGLGLSIVAHAVATLGGEIYGKNGANGGLEVHFSLSK